MKLKPNRFFTHSIYILGFVSLIGCSTSNNFSFPKQQLTASPAPVLIWEPEYYSYKNGKFQFMEGYYRPVIGRKKHFKRSIKGYMTKVKG